MQTQPGSALAPETTADLFALTDEQILEIAPEAQDVEANATAPEIRAESGTAEAQPAATENTTATQSRGPFAAPEDVRALAELYPGGLSQAKTAAERARALDDIDRAYFGTGAGTPEHVSASRAQLAQQMLRDDPAAFREMVFAGLRALQDANVSPAASQNAAQPRQGAAAEPSVVVAQHGAPVSGNDSRAAGAHRADEAQASAYATFERTANEELERSVGSAISRTIQQALPNVARSQDVLTRAGQAPPLQERLASAVRQDVEAALKGDRQLGEQIAQILAARRFDEPSRAQVVRLIGERAQQLVPSATRRVINEWTGTTLAAHGAKSERSGAVAAKREIAPAAVAQNSSQPSGQRNAETERGVSRQRSVDYRKLSDDQILDL